MLSQLQCDHNLRWAAMTGELGDVVSAINQGANVQTENGTPLTYAALRGYSYIVRVLIDSGADVHDDEDNALWSALKNNHLEVIKILLKEGDFVFDDQMCYDIVKRENQMSINERDAIDYLKSYVLKKKRIEELSKV